MYPVSCTTFAYELCDRQVFHTVGTDCVIDMSIHTVAVGTGCVIDRDIHTVGTPEWRSLSAGLSQTWQNTRPDL